MSHYILHQLIDRVPEEELSAAKRFLEYLAVKPSTSGGPVCAAG